MFDSLERDCQKESAGFGAVAFLYLNTKCPDFITCLDEWPWRSAMHSTPKTKSGRRLGSIWAASGVVGLRFHTVDASRLAHLGHDGLCPGNHGKRQLWRGLILRGLCVAFMLSPSVLALGCSTPQAQRAAFENRAKWSK